MHCHEQNNSEQGFALILVLAILLTLSVFSVGVMMSTSTNNVLSKNFEKATQALNMAEIGTKVAYRELINGGYLKTTHTLNHEEAESGESLLETTLQNFTIDDAGFFRWEWPPQAGSHPPMFDTELEHGFRFRVYYSTENSFVIESEGWFGNIHKRVRAKGELESMFQFSYFASRNMGEFVRGASQAIRGKVHANGDLYVRPSGSRLDVITNSFTATGSIIRSRDAWGRPDQSGSCYITENDDSGTLVEITPGSPRGSEGVAYESANPIWDDSVNGARERWSGVVRDKVPFKSPPPVRNLDVGEYYDLEADLDMHIDQTTHIANPTWADADTIYNSNEDMWHYVMTIDIGAMSAAGKWPTNGLIYCNTKTRFTNAASLQDRLMIASNSIIYLQGDFNTVAKKGAGVMTTHRIYYLSNSWNKTADYTTSSTRPVASNTRYNAALVDGAPTVDEYNWCDRDANRCYDYSNNARKIYLDWNDKTAAGFQNPYNSSDPWANCDDLIENWSGMTLNKYGSTVHLEGAVMCDHLDNSDYTNARLAWVRKTGYSPPTRVYEYDPDLSDPSSQPPFTPLIGHITTWEPCGEFN